MLNEVLFNEASSTVNNNSHKKWSFGCYNSILRVWEFFQNEQGVECNNTPSRPVILSSFEGFLDTNCYILLHMYRSNPVKDISSVEPPKTSKTTILDIAQTTKTSITPKGKSDSFGCYSCVVSNKTGTSTEIKFDIYIWNGTQASTNLKTSAFEAVFEIDSALKSGKSLVGVENSEHNLIPLSSVITCDCESLSANEWENLINRNHLFGTLNKAHPFYEIKSTPKKKKRKKKRETLHSAQMNTVPSKSKLPKRRESKSKRKKCKRLFSL